MRMRAWPVAIGVLAGSVVPPVAAAQIADTARAVHDVAFDGNRALGDDALRVSIATQRSSFMARSPLVRWLGAGRVVSWRPREFRRDVLRLKALYGVSGFPNATVDTVIDRDNGTVRLRFVIDEGAPVIIESLEILGIDSIVPLTQVRTALPLTVGRPLDRLQLQTSANLLRAMLRDRGFPFAQVAGSFEEDRANRTARVLFAATPGVRTWIGQVEIVGGDRVADEVVRRALAVAPGQLFSDSLLYESQLTLYRTGMYELASVTLADTLPPAPGDTTVSVRVRVLEGSLTRLRTGVGYGTLDCFRGLGSVTRNDFTGGGRTLQVSARVSQIGTGAPTGVGFERSVCPALANEDPARRKLNFNLSASLQQPYLGSPRTSGALSVFAERHTELQAFLREVVGGELSLTHRPRVDLVVSVAYGLSYGSTKADAAVFCTFLNLCRVQDAALFVDPRLRSAVSLGVVRDRSDSPIDPRRGSVVNADVRWASRRILSDSLVQFAKLVGQVASYHPVSGGSVFAWRVRGGGVVAPRTGLAGARQRFVPPEERFFGGGPSGVRGFSQNELGPVIRVAVSSDEGESEAIRTAAVGGLTVLQASVEWRLPLDSHRRAWGAVFLDAGQVADDLPSVFENWRVTPGIGGRIASPVGPLRLDLAYNPYRPPAAPLYREVDSDLVVVDPAFRPDQTFLGRFRLHFSIGQAF